MPTRRGFFKSLTVAAGAAIVAPSIAETLAVNAKKYFFLGANPLSENINPGLLAYSMHSRYLFPGQILQITNVVPPGKFNGCWKVKSTSGNIVKLSRLEKVSQPGSWMGLSRSMVAEINNDAL